MRTSPVFSIGLAAMFVVGTAVLLAKLYEVQVVGAAEAREDHNSQSTRRLQTAGRRGRILDASGVVLADSRACRNLVCRPEAFKSSGGISNVAAAVDAAMDRLAETVRLPRRVSAEDIARHLRRESPLPIVAYRDVDSRALALFADSADELRGFEIETTSERVYPYGPLAVHVVGYTGTGTPESGAPGVVIHYTEKEPRGRAGLERRYDGYLAGAPGARRIKVDVRGFAPETDAGDTEKSPETGLDLRISLDAKLQLAMERELKGVRGAGVALDPDSGAVLALASAPAYDPTKLRKPGEFARLLENPDLPLLNRAISGLYAPGSTFKPIVALAALEAGWNPDRQLFCDGAWRKTRCTATWGHGAISLRGAMEKSCNPFFLQLAENVDGKEILDMARRFGLGERTGIDLDGESSGSLGEWHFQSAIGQGPLLVTPLQMAVVTATLANGGKVYRPFLHARDGGRPVPVRTIDAEANNLAEVRAGMVAVVERGNAQKAFHPERDGERMTLAVQAAGKTGSAEVRRGSLHWKNTWFMAFAPLDKPTVAVAMLVEHGEFGGTTVAPRVYNFLKAVFGEKEVPAS